MEIVVIIVLGILTFLNILVPYSGSAIVTPLLALLVPNPQLAIGLASFYFLMSCIIRFFFFRSDIQWHEIKNIAPISIIFAILGGFLLVNIPYLWVMILIFIFMFYFLYKKIRDIKGIKKIENNKFNKFLVFPIAALSGFFQGAGIGGGSDIRNGYLYSKQYSLAQVHGTTTIIGGLNFFIAISIRLISGSVTIPNLLPLLYVLPFMVIATYYGKRVLHKMDKRIANFIIIVIIIVITILLGIDIIKTILL